MTYARARLLVGITGVGKIVVLSAAALVAGWPGMLLPDAPGPIGLDVAALAAVVLLHVLVLAPYDVLGGYVLPRRHGRSRLPFVRFLAGWFRGVAVQSSVVIASGVALLAAGRAAGVAGATATFAGITVLLVLAQASLARLAGGFDVVDRRAEVWTVRAQDTGFTGGVVGPPGRERFLVPERWAGLLGSRGVAAELARWSAAVETGGRRRGLLVALAWNLIGFVIATRLPGADVVSVSGLVTIALGFTLWSFVGLLTLPSVSRPAVVAADRAARDAVREPGVLEQTLSALDRQQDDEAERGAAVETVFHPIPALSRRLRALAAPDGPRPGAWHAARTALFLSWAGFGFLSRAVHCNAGRPELWVLLPCD